MKLFLCVALLCAVTAQAQEVEDKRQNLYPEFRSVVAEARAKGDCVKSLATGSVYNITTEGRVLLCGGRYTWIGTDEVQVEFYAKNHKAGHFLVVKCECK